MKRLVVTASLLRLLTTWTAAHFTVFLLSWWARNHRRSPKVPRSSWVQVIQSWNWQHMQMEAKLRKKAPMTQCRIAVLTKSNLIQTLWDFSCRKTSQRQLRLPTKHLHSSLNISALITLSTTCSKTIQKWYKIWGLLLNWEERKWAPYSTTPNLCFLLWRKL
jgi:hypothetical protein